MSRVLVVASTFPASETDAVPAFVRDQVIAMKQLDASLNFSVLAPHDKRSNTVSFRSHKYYDEYRFHYAWPSSFEKLAGRGIMPALQANPLNYLLIPALFLGEFIALYRLVRHTKPDTIYAHWFTPQAINARIVGSLTKTPFVFTTHASDVSVWHKLPVVGPLIVRSNVRKAKAFTAVSRRSMDKLAWFFSPTEWDLLKLRTCIIPMGVNLPEVSASNIKQPEPYSILFVGRLAEKKGVQYLLPAFKGLLDTLPAAKLTVAGDGPWLDRLKTQAAKLGLTSEQVSFPGYVTGAAKQDLINSHLVFVVPSIITESGDAEGLPVSLMEGLAAGKLCIASVESGADDIISEGKDGYLVPQKDPASLRTALQTALTQEESAVSEMSRLARETAIQFSWPHIASEHISFLLKD